MERKSEEEREEIVREGAKGASEEARGKGRQRRQTQRVAAEEQLRDCGGWGGERREGE